MRFLKFNLLLLLLPTLSFALSSSDDVVCSGGKWNDKRVYLRTEGRENLLLFMCDGECSQPPYFFEASYKVTTFKVESTLNGHPHLHIRATGQDGGNSIFHFVKVNVDLWDVDYAASLVMTPPGDKNSLPDGTIQVSFSRCNEITGGNRPEPTR